MSALAITPAVTSVNNYRTKTFVASGGTAPYVFSLVSGLGSINASTGVYTAPSASSTAVVEVTDSLGAIATAQITVNTALTLFCDILETEMGLANDQVYLWDQKINIPSDFRLYIPVGVVSCKPFSNTLQFDGTGSGLTEILSTNFKATLSVDILSRGTDARDRKEEVILALRSVYSQQQQEANGFYIAGISSSFSNLSQIDGAAIPYRFNISVNIQYQITKTKAAPYYDTFSDSVITDPPQHGG